jgi:glutathione S-transferase
MAKITLYGTANSRANRAIWALKELGLEYDHKPIDFRKGETNTPEYLSMNPMPTLPTLKDGDLIVHESCAINLYLAKKYPGGQLAKLTEQEEIEATQWSFWSMWNIERHTTEILMHTILLPEAQRDPKAVERAKEQLKRPLAAIDKFLSSREYLLGNKFTVADLNMAAIAAALPRFNVDISAFPKFKAWLEKCRARPASQAASQAQAEAAKAA